MTKPSRLKIKRNIWLLADMCVRKQPIIALYFESETVLRFYNLEAQLTLRPAKTDQPGHLPTGRLIRVFAVR